MNIFVQMIAKAIGIADWQVEHTLDLLDGGATIPFISRYRKEATGSLDEVKIAEIKEQSDKLKEIQKRKETVLSTIEEQGKLTDELKKRIENCGTQPNSKISICLSSQRSARAPRLPVRRGSNRLLQSFSFRTNATSKVVP